MLDVMYERLNGDEQSRIMKKLAEAGRRARVQKQERLQAELARVRERVESEEEERRERRALQARIEERKLEKQRAEIAAEMRRKAGGVRPVREKTFGDKFAEAVATSDAVRKVAIAAQEIANSPLNPANLFMKAYNFSNGDGFKTGLEDVVKPETKTERAIGAGTRVLYDLAMEGIIASGAGLAIKAGAPLAKKAGIEVVETVKDAAASRGLGKAYDIVKKNPTVGRAEDILTSFKLNGRTIGMPRGGAVAKDGKLITQGKELKNAIGTKRNYGMTKDVFLHNMSKRDVMMMRRSMRKSQNVEITESGKRIFKNTYRPDKVRKTVTSRSQISDKVDDIIASDYWDGVDKMPKIDW